VLNKMPGMPRNALYTMLYQGGADERAMLGPAGRAGCWAFFVLSSPIALALSVAAAIARRGATIHIVARREV
jgi:hypothetical protein